MPDNYKSYFGVDKLYYALITQDDADAYIAGDPVYLAPVMNITVKPKTNQKVQYADNQPFDSMSSEGESETEVEITALPLNKEATLLGKVWDAVNSRYYDNGGTPPYVALGYRALKSDGNFKYYWYLKCQFAPSDEEAATRTDTPDPKSTKLKLTAIRTIHEFDLDGSLTDSVKRVVADDAIDTVDEDVWFADVQTPNPGTPSSLTCTPSPADAATGVAVGVSPTLTFNNALRTGVTGIALLSDAGAVIAAAITIDGTAKIITINPDSDLSASTTYLIVVSGARDIYGQTLAITAYDFTTA